MSAPNVLPDSRLHNKDFGCLMVDWELPDGTFVRIEVIPVFCMNCGKLYGHVPKENTAFVGWLCRKCFEDYGEITGTYAMPEEEFGRKVQYEMQARFGKDLTDVELFQLAEQGRLGTPLELLCRESPFPTRK